MRGFSKVGMDLRLFDGATGAAAVAGAGAPAAGVAVGDGAGGENAKKPGVPSKRAERNPLAQVQYGTQAEGAKKALPVAEEKAAPPSTEVTTGDAQRREAAFEQMIKGEYKDLFDGRVQQIIDGRFKQTKAMEQRVQGVEPILEMLASKYGVDASDPQKMLKALEEDTGFYEEEALRMGMSVEQLKAYKQMERENAQLRRMQETRQQQEARERLLAQWHQQAEQAKAVYPNMDLRGEIENPKTGRDFLSLLQNHVPVQTAYEVVHKDEIIGGAMQYAANQAREKTVSDIRARGMRPEENGAGGVAPATMKTDVSKLTKADRAEIARRVARGEKITFD